MLNWGLSDGWFAELRGDATALSLSTSIPRTRLSTVDGLSYAGSLDSEEIGSLESLLSAAQRMNLKQLPIDRLREIRRVGEGQTFSVSESKFDGDVIAIKRIRLPEDHVKQNLASFRRQLQAVLREILIMNHPPLADHPNAISLLGYGWGLDEHRLSPIIAVEFAPDGSLRNYLRISERPFATKEVLVADIAGGLMALHKCGIVHGDLKIDNVLVVPAPDRPSIAIAKVSDFGHSIILNSASERSTRYFGTAPYNAPEVGRQNTHPISPEDLHKCDIWAFGLCVWEVLANGQKYFQISWNEAAASYRLQFPLKPSQDGQLAAATGGQPIPAPCRLKNLAQSFLNTIKFPVPGLEKRFLHALFERTLQAEPSQRISDLSRLPVMTSSSRNRPLGSALTALNVTATTRYSIFTRGNGVEISWPQQRQLLHDLETEADSTSESKSTTTAAFQVMLCYINAFGTSRNYQKAATVLRQAREGGHTLARIFGPRIEACLLQTSAAYPGYTESLALSFRTAKQLHPRSTEFPDYNAVKRALILNSPTSAGYADTSDPLVRDNQGQIHYNRFFEVAIDRNDTELVGVLLSMATEKLLSLDVDKKSLLQRAAWSGNVDVVELLVKKWDSIETISASLLLHWLFCFSDADIDRLTRLLQGMHGDKLKKNGVLNQIVPASERVVLHSQWPFEVQGIPLATAIAAGSICAVRALLQLGADPLAPAILTSEDECMAHFIPLHIAVKYQFPEIFKLLWAAAFPHHRSPLMPPPSHPDLDKFPLPCALSLLTTAERMAVHGSKYLEKIQTTVQLFPSELLSTQATDGTTAVTQAIDREDIDSLEALLACSPDLVKTKIRAPSEESVYTYPLHFAIWVSLQRESAESISIVHCILQSDPTVIDRPDGSLNKPVHIAAMESRTSIMQLLLDRGASPNSRGRLDRTPLHDCQSAAMVQLLHFRRVAVNHRDLTGCTAAHVAANQGRDDVLRALIDCGADINITDHEECTALHAAAREGHLEATKILLEAGAIVDAQNIHKETALLLALKTEQYDTAHTLFDHGASPFIPDVLATSPFLAAVTSKDASLLNRFLNHPDAHSLSWDEHATALLLTVARGEPAVLKLYLQVMHPLLKIHDATDARLGLAALHKAATAFRVDIAEVLILYGFSVDGLDARGNTPLLSVCAENREPNQSDYFQSAQQREMCKYLLLKGADILAVNKAQETAFTLALRYDDIPLMALLLDHAVVQVNENIPLHRALKHPISVSRLFDIVQSVFAGSRPPPLARKAKKIFDNEATGRKLLKSAIGTMNWALAANLIAGRFVADPDVWDLFDLNDETRGLWLLPSDASVHRNRYAGHVEKGPFGIWELSPQNKVLFALLHFYAEQQDSPMVWYIYNRGRSSFTGSRRAEAFRERFLEGRRLVMQLADRLGYVGDDGTLLSRSMFEHYAAFVYSSS